MVAQFSTVDLESEKSRILDALNKFPAAFASASALGLKTPRAKVALAQLVEAGQLRQFGPKNRPLYRSSDRCSENELVELAAAQLQTLHKGGAPALIPFRRADEALRKFPAAIREYKLPALKRLAERKEVIVFQHGKLKLFVFTASLGEYLQSARQPAQPTGAAPAIPSTDNLRERIHQAYNELMTTRRSPDVPIAELYAKVGGPLDAFHEVLRKACFEHRAVPTLGEPAFAAPIARDQALAIEGEKFLNIKFLS